MPGALHIVTGRLRADASSQSVTQAETAAQALIGAPGAQAVVIGKSDDRLVIVTWLEGRDVLEAFAASREHMAFVMQGLAPVIAGMWSAAVEGESRLPPADAGALWVWALPARDGVYEWQVRDLFAAIEDLPGAVAHGPTVEERERFRAAGVICIPEAMSTQFEAQLAAARNAWQPVTGALEEALVPVRGDIRRA